MPKTRTDEELKIVLLEKSKAVHGTGCFIWSGTKNVQGYGKIKRQNKDWSTHRLAYFLFKDVNIDGFVICHHCDNPSCVNPNHLFKGTTLDNVRDKISKGRDSTTVTGMNRQKTHCKNGHEFTKDNTYISPVGRHCKLCRAAADKRRVRV